MRLDFSVMKKSKRSSLSFYFFTLLPFYFYIIRIVLLQSGRAEQPSLPDTIRRIRQ